MASGINSGSSSSSQSIWPKGRGAPVDSAGHVEEVQRNNKNVDAPASPVPTEAPSRAAGPAAAETTKVAPKPTIARPMVEADIADALINLRKALNPENKQILMAMIQHGVEASEDNFNMIKRLKQRSQGRQGSSIESAVVSLAKGLSGQPKSVDMLSAFLSNNVQLSKEAQKLIQQMATFRSAMVATQNLFDQGLITGLSAILVDMDDQLKKLTKKSADDRMNINKLKRGTLVKDFFTLNGFLSGLGDKIGGTPGSDGMLKQLDALQGQVAKFLDALTTQGVLSKDPQHQQLGITEKFAYWQIPNPMATSTKDIDILIRKDPLKKGGVDPDKTRMVLKMETDKLGEVGITADIKDQKIWYTFEIEKEQTQKVIAETGKDLIERMETINYQTMGFRSVRRKAEVKKLLLPTFNLDSIARVSTEI